MRVAPLLALLSTGVIALALCPVASASTYLTGAKVVSVRVDSNGHAIATFASNLGGTPPACAIAQYSNALALDTTTDGGRSLLALLITAEASGETVSVYGSGACNVYGYNVEDLSDAISAPAS